MIKVEKKSSLQPPNSINSSKVQKILVPDLDNDKNLQYLLEFDSQKREDQENLYKFLKNNQIKFDKNIPERVYQAVVLLKNVDQNDMNNLSQEKIKRNIPPEISPKKVEQHKQEKERKKAKRQNYTYNMYGEKVYLKEEGVYQRLTKSPTTKERWKIKGLDQLQKNFDKQKENKKMELNLKNMPSNNVSPQISNREYLQAYNSSINKKSVSFYMSSDQNEVYASNKPQEVFDSFEELKQSIHSNKQQKQQYSSGNSQSQSDCQTSLNTSLNKIYRSDQQQLYLKSSLKPHKIIPEEVYNQPSNSNKKIAFTINIRKSSENSQDQIFRRIDDSYIEETHNIFNQMFSESFQFLPCDKQKSQSFINIDDDYNYKSHSQQKIPSQILLTDEDLGYNSNATSSNIPKKINKNNIDPNQSYILKALKEKEEQAKNMNKNITNTNFKNIKSKLYDYIHAKLKKKGNKEEGNIQDLTNSFLDNLRQKPTGKPLPKKVDKDKSKLNQSLNLSQSRIQKGSVYSGDSKYNSIERSLNLSKVLDPVSQKQLEILQKYNDNFRIKSGLQFHKYCLVGQEDKDEKRFKDNKNLLQSQILQRYAEKEKSLLRPNFEWELTEEDMSDLDCIDELTPQNFDKFAEIYNKWWFNLQDSDKMHFYSSEELMKYYKDVKKVSKKSLFNFLKQRKPTRVD